MNFGQRGKDLVASLKRSEWLGPYDEDGVRSVLAEMRQLWEELFATLEGGQREQLPETLVPGLVLHNQALQRNKRCLMVYLQHRLGKLRALRWETGAALPDEFDSNVSLREREYSMEYDRIVREYSQATGLDLTVDLEPPKELFIEVRAKKDCGEVLTSDGSVNLEKDSIHFLRRSDVEHLIRRGMLEQTD